MLPALFEIHRLGIWLFMSEMPFGTLSVQMLWKLFYLMHQVESGNLENLCALPPAECKKQLQGIALLKLAASSFPARALVLIASLLLEGLRNVLLRVFG